jgi:hypothetical protein
MGDLAKRSVKEMPPVGNVKTGGRSGETLRGCLNSCCLANFDLFLFTKDIWSREGGCFVLRGSDDAGDASRPLFRANLRANGPIVATD